jgi:fido (protein-threonine AMPylation protein)
MPGIGAEIVLTVDGELRKTRLFRSHEQAEPVAAIAHADDVGSDERREHGARRSARKMREMSRRHDAAAKVRRFSRPLVVIEDAQSRVIDEGDTRSWHMALFERLVPIPYYSGEFRQDDPARPCLGQDVAVGDTPDAPFAIVVRSIAGVFEQFNDDLIQIELWFAGLSPADRAVRVAQLAAFLVGAFLRVHPFVNGNGRLPRLLWAWVLQRFRLPPQCRLQPRPGRPYAELMRAAMSGNYAPLTLHILRSMSGAPSVA